MRISCAAFARIRDKDGRYALLVNKGRLNAGGGRVLSPIGGALEVNPRGKAHLMRLGATKFESPLDLRFQIPDSRVPEVIEWFKARSGREKWVMRELKEELAKEVKVVTQADLRGSRQRFVSYHRHDGKSNTTGLATVFLIEVFEVTLPERAMRKLLVAAEVPVKERWVYFVTRREFGRGVTDDNVSIGDIARYVLN